MKRCPQCKFIYLDQDEVCDLDGTPLVMADEAELDRQGVAAPASRASTPKRKLVLGVAAAAVAGALVSSMYLGVTGKFSRARPENTETAAQQASPVSIAAPSPTPAELVSPSPSPESTPVNNTPPPASATANSSRGVVSRDPVSTGDSSGAAAVKIRLTNGATVEADEVWRTKQGVWYRRDGIVTLLKPSQVKSIEKAKTAKAAR